MRPWGPTTKGRDRAFQCWSASGASPGVGRSGRQLRPSSVEMSVPLGPTVIQVLVVGGVGYRGAEAVRWGGGV